MKLYKHQERALQCLQNEHGFALYMEQGTGKTIPTLMYVTDLFISQEISNCLIVAPVSTVGAWVRDIHKLSLYRQKYARGIEITTYGKVWRRAEYDKPWDCIILDEAHKISHRTSKQTKFIMLLSKMMNKDYRIILTGTPIANGRLEDYYSLSEFIKPGIFGKWKDFANQYLIERQLPGTFINIIVGYRNQSELLDLIAPYCYRVKKDECLDLPEKLPDEVIEVELKEKVKYREAKSNFIEEFEMNIGNPLTKVAKLRQIVSGFVYDDYHERHSLKCDKLNTLWELLEGILPNKVVIFCDFKYSMESIDERLTKNKVKHIMLNGSTKNKNIWKDFQNDPSIQVIVIQYLTGNAGIDLFASSHMIFYEPNLSTTIIDQCRDRIHRIGTIHPCSYYWLITKGTIEEQIYKSLQNKSDFNASTLQRLVDKRELL